MKTNLLSLCVIALASSALTSCEDIYEGGQKDLPEVAVQLKAQITPYAKDRAETLADNAKVGVYMISTETDAALTSNAEMAVDADGIVDTGGRLFYPKDGTKVNIICYAPYQASAAEGNTIGLDVSTHSAAVASDYLYSANRNKYMALAPVKVQLKHILSLVTFDVKAGEGVTDDDLAGIAFTLNNMPVQAAFDLIAGEYTVNAEGNIPVNVSDAGHKAECFAIPCSTPNFIVGCSYNGLTFTKKLGPLDFQPGNMYKFDIVVNEPGFDIALRQIEDWVVEEY